MTDVLAKICADKRTHIAGRKQAKPIAQLEREAAAAGEPRGFLDRLKTTAEGGRFALICEIKRASPSGGLIRADFDPPALARAYEAGGAACLSVLTDEPYFQGRDADLVAARAACGLPVLRKDFMLDAYQIVEARALGADCILLIMAALDDETARELEATAMDLGMDVVAEVHDKPELDRALRLRTPMIGINNRDLKTLKTDLQTTERLARDVPDDRLLVAESGIRTADDLARLSAAGVDAFLVGESLMRQNDVAAATRTLAMAAVPEPAASQG